MFRNIFLNDNVILGFIIVNSLLVFLGGFDFEPNVNYLIFIFDNLLTLIFVVELVVKLKVFGKKYFESKWNKFDFVLILISIPSLITLFGIYFANDLSFLLVLRVLRAFKSFRFLKFIPGIEHLLNGVRRALKNSFLAIIGFIVYLFIVGMISFFLFKDISVEYYGNPLNSIYSTFKIFTVEGWYDIPDNISKNLIPYAKFFVYIYFAFVVITGGILGLSLVNSIFVDAMISESNDEMERKIEILETKIDMLLQSIKTTNQIDLDKNKFDS
ncbi:MAG: ion transporter [Candidatus Kapaibacteriota bacterium]